MNVMKILKLVPQRYEGYEISVNVFSKISHNINRPPVSDQLVSWKLYETLEMNGVV